MVNYLDMTIWQQDSTWKSKLYDKRVELQAKVLKLNKFPHPEIKITTRCKYGVISSQLHRFKSVQDTLTIKPTAIKYRYKKQQVQARKQPNQVDSKH